MVVIIGFILIFVFGYLVVSSVSTRLTLEERVPLSFGFGLGFLTLLMFYLSRLGIPLNLGNILASLILLSAFLKTVFLRQRPLIPHFPLNFKKIFLLSFGVLVLMLITFVFNKLRIFFHPRAFVVLTSLISVFLLGSILLKKKQIAGYFMLSLLVFSFLGVLVLGLYWPVVEWDSLALYDFVGKLFFWQKAVSLPLNLPNLDYYSGYPLLTPVAHTFVYFLGGQNPKFIYSLFYLSLLLVFFSFLKRETTPAISLFFTLILGTTNMVIEQGVSSYTNLPFAFYQITGVLFFYRFAKEKNKRDLLLSGISFGLSSWTRAAAEFYFLTCFLILIGIVWRFKPSQRLFFPLGFLLLYLIIGYPWQIYAKSLGTQTFDVGWVIKGNVYAFSHYPQNYFNVSAVFTVVKRLLINLSDFKLFGGGGILLFLSLLLSPKNIKKEKILVFLIGLNLLFWIGSVYWLGVIGNFKPSWQMILEDSMARVFLGIYPLLLLFVAKTDLVFEVFEGKRGKQ